MPPTVTSGSSLTLSTTTTDNNNIDASNATNPPGLSPYILQTSSEVNTEQSYHAVQMASRNYCFAHNTYYIVSWCPTCSFNI
jgi:hypothetical protein